MFWLVCLALIAVAMVAILSPVAFGRDKAAQPAAAYDLAVYRQQLAEVERDHARGTLSADEAARLRTEIARKMIGADRALAKAPQAGSGPPAATTGGLTLPLLVLGAAMIGAALLYILDLGSPGFPDQPISRRYAESVKTYAARPHQAEAEAAHPPQEQPPEDPEFAKLMDQLRTAVKNRPQDQQGLMLLAGNEARLGRFAAARAAQEQLIAAKGPAATSEDYAVLAGMMVAAAGGLITPEAEAAITKSLSLDPANPQARYLAGLLDIQIGRPDRAFPIWRDLLDEAPNAPWAAPVRQAITDLAWFAGDQRYRPPVADGPATGLPGPDADAIAGAAEMSPEDRQNMIESMVAGLENRLATQGGRPEEWARLIFALSQLGQTDRAAAIWAEAKTQFARNADALATIDEAAARAGLSSDRASPPTESPADDLH